MTVCVPAPVVRLYAYLPFFRYRFVPSTTLTRHTTLYLYRARPPYDPTHQLTVPQLISAYPHKNHRLPFWYAAIIYSASTIFFYTCLTTTRSLPKNYPLPRSAPPTYTMTIKYPTPPPIPVFEQNNRACRNETPRPSRPYYVKWSFYHAGVSTTKHQHLHSIISEA